MMSSRNAATNKAAAAKGKKTQAKKPPPTKKTIDMPKWKEFFFNLVKDVDPRWRPAVVSMHQETMTFRSGFINRLLMDCMQNHNKIIRKTSAENLAKEINEKLEIMDASHFLEFGFLNTDDDFESKLKDYSSERLKSFSDVMTTDNLDDKFLELLESGRLLAALVYLLGNQKLGVLLLDSHDIQEVELLSENSAASRARRYIYQTSGTGVTPPDKLELANAVYLHCQSNYTNSKNDTKKPGKKQGNEVGRSGDDEPFGQIYKESKRMYQSILETTLEEYRVYVENRYNNDNGPPLPGRATWAVGDAMKHSRRYLPLLVGKKFSQLNREQDAAYFRWMELPSNAFNF